MPSPAVYPILEIQPEWVLEPEVLGSKEKFWYRDPDGESEWLFKYPQSGTGQHWSEKIAAEIAASGYPARTGGTGGFPADERFIHGDFRAERSKPVSRQPDSGGQCLRLQATAAFWSIRPHAGEHFPGAGADIYQPGGHSQGEGYVRRIPRAGRGHRQHRPAP